MEESTKLSTSDVPSHHEGVRSHDHDLDPAVFLTEEFWDERYRSAEQIWSGNPNARLVEHAADLTPGAALDVGSGEGADAIWLASRGWRVTGIELSTVALARAAERAAAVGQEIAARITWQQADVLTWDSAGLQFDLVSAHFMHLPTALEPLHWRLAMAVRPGGTLLVVGHHPSDMETTMRRPNVHDMFFTADQVAATLPRDEWEIVYSGAPEREAVDPEGRPITIRDAVLRAQRRS